MTSLSSLVHFSSDPAFAVDAHGTLIAWNRSAEEVLGYRAKEVIGRSCHEILRAKTPQGQLLCTRRCAAQVGFQRCHPFGGDALCLSKDGGVVRTRLSSIVVPGQEGTSSEGAIIFVRPVGPTAVVLARPLLCVYTLGEFSMLVGERPLPFQSWERKQPVTLLKYLLSNRSRLVHREEVIDLLWPEVSQRQGLERLKVTVYFLRRELRQAGWRPDGLRRVGESYALAMEDVWLDAQVFEGLVHDGDTLASQARSIEALSRYNEAARLYRGEFLEEDRYADWCAMERERLQELYVCSLSRAASLSSARGDYQGAIGALQRGLAKDPCRESLHRDLMRCLWKAGRRDEALAQYQICARHLAQELGVQPTAETRQLHHAILARDSGTLAAPAPLA